MTSIKINGVLYPAEIFGRKIDGYWDMRETKEITLEMTYEDAKALFVDGLKWSIVYEDENGVQEYDNSTFNLAGSITDNRNGTISAKMGKPTVDELLAILNNKEA